MSISAKFSLCALFAAILATTSAHALTIQETQVDPGDTFQTGTTATFTCIVVSGSAISFTWNFDDNTGDFVTVSNTITHTFNTEDIFQVIVRVTDGNPANDDADIIIVEAVNPPPANSPVGVGANDPVLTNPDDGLGIDITNQQGGVVSFQILTDDPSGSAAARASDEFTTKWGDDPSDLDGRRGNPMVHKYGTFNADPNPRKGGVATIEVERKGGGGSIIGKMRKTLAFSNRELNGGTNTESNDDSVSDKKIGVKSFAGKFAFQKFGFNDQVTISWTMTLPAGFAPATQIMTLSVGNVTEDVEIDSKGKGKIDKRFPGVFTSVKLKYPKLAKGTTTTAAPFLTTVTAKMKQEDLEEAGFDTEGVSARANHPRGSTGPVLGPKDRDIQVLSVFAGVGYSGIAKVTINVDKNDDIGSLKARR